MMRIFRLPLFVAVFIFAAAIAAMAEEVVFLKSGLVYEGRIKSMKTDFLELETDAGLMRIPVSDLDNSKAPNGMIHFDRIPILKVYQIKFDRKDESRAEKVLDKIKAGGDFESLANSFSIDVATRDSLGNMGFVRAEEMAPEIAAAAFQLKIGDASALVYSNDGIHILKVTDIRFKDRDTGEFFDSKGNALPLSKVAISIYKTTNTGKPAEDAKAADKFYAALKAALEKYSLFTVIEVPAAAPDFKKLEKEETGQNHYLVSDVSIGGEFARYSYRLGRAYNIRMKGGETTVPASDNADSVAEKFAAEIFSVVPKEIDAIKLEAATMKSGKSENLQEPAPLVNPAPPAPPNQPAPPIRPPMPPRDRPAQPPQPQPPVPQPPAPQPGPK